MSGVALFPILPGSIYRPEVKYPMYKRTGEKDGTKLTTTQDSLGNVSIRFDQTSPFKKTYQLHKLNYCDWVPAVSVFSGLFRGFLGIIHTIYHLVKYFFDEKNKSSHQKEISLGSYSFLRGFVAIFPGVGNVVMIFLDLYKIKEAKERYEKIVKPVLGSASFFITEDQIIK